MSFRAASFGLFPCSIVGTPFVGSCSIVSVFVCCMRVLLREVLHTLCGVYEKNETEALLVLLQLAAAAAAAAVHVAPEGLPS